MGEPELFRLIIGPGHPRQPFTPELRERDLLWVQSILSAQLDPKDIAKIVTWFNGHRPD